MSGKSRFHTATSTVEKELKKDYVLGHSDCFFMGLRVADSLEGSDLVGLYEGSYSSFAEVPGALAARGCSDLRSLLAAHWPEQAPAMARVGDLALVQIGSYQHVAVCFGSRFLTKTEEGRRWLDLADVLISYRVG